MFAGATHLSVSGRNIKKANALIRILLATPSTLPTLTGLLGGVLALLESTTGVYSSDPKKNLRGVNDFMSHAEMRLKLTHMIGASAMDDSSAMFINTKQFKKYFRRLSKSVKSTASFQQLVSVVLQRIYHVWASVPAPPFFEHGQNITAFKHEYKGPNIKSNPTMSRALNRVKFTYKLLNDWASAKAKMERAGQGAIGSDTGALPKNVDYFRYDVVDSAGLYQVAEADHNDKKTKVETKGIANLNGVPEGNWGKLGQQICREMGLAPWGKKHTSTASKQSARKIINAFNAVQDAYEVWKDVTDSIGSHPEGGQQVIKPHIWKVRVLLQRALALLGLARARKPIKVPIESPINRRLLCFMFHPDLYMVPPPRCNVLFPNHIQAISFSRSWMSEISRLWLHGRKTSGRAKKDVYFAPNTAILGVDDKDALAAVKAGQSFLMPHEVYTGIVSSIMGLGDNDTFKKQHRKSEKEYKDEKKKGLAKGDSRWNARESFGGDAANSAKPHLQRAANFMFFAQRFAGRTMRISCRYSPQLVTGLPCLVLDPVKNKDTGAWGGTHYVGTIAVIKHELHAAGGAATTLVLTKCRTHDECADIFKKGADDLLSSERRPPRKTGWKQIRSKKAGMNGKFYVAKLGDPPSTGRPGGRELPYADQNYRKILSDGDVANKYSAKKKYKMVPSYEGKKLKTTESDGVTWYLMKVFEATRGKAPEPKESQFTFEGTTMPPWFSSIYWPAKIGSSYYQEMLGCESILDGGVVPLAEDDGSISFYTDVLSDDATILEMVDAGENNELIERKAAETDSVKVSLGGIGGAVASLIGDAKDAKDEPKAEKTLEIPRQFFTETFSTKTAADNLGQIWGKFQDMGVNMDLYIDLFTQRNYANIPQILCRKNDDIKLSEGGGPDYSSYVPAKAAHDLVVSTSSGLISTDTRGDMTGPVNQHGFHAFSYGKVFENNEPAVLGNVSLLTNFGSKARKIMSDVDVRKKRYEVIEEYLQDIKKHGYNQEK